MGFVYSNKVDPNNQAQYKVMKHTNFEHKGDKRVTRGWPTVVLSGARTRGR